MRAVVRGDMRAIVRGGTLSADPPTADPRSRDAASLWASCPELGADPAQTRASRPASVSAECGGTKHPTQGGGFWFSREHGPVGSEVPR
jgi:hypothetical protein